MKIPVYLVLWEESPHPIPMTQGTWGLPLGLELPSFKSPHKKALEARGPSCAAQVLRPEEQAVGAERQASPREETGPLEASARAGTRNLFSMCLEPGRSFLG